MHQRYWGIVPDITLYKDISSSLYHPNKNCSGKKRESPQGDRTLKELISSDKVHLLCGSPYTCGRMLDGDEVVVLKAALDGLKIIHQEAPAVRDEVGRYTKTEWQLMSVDGLSAILQGRSSLHTMRKNVQGAIIEVVALLQELLEAELRRLQSMEWRERATKDLLGRHADPYMLQGLMRSGLGDPEDQGLVVGRPGGGGQLDEWEVYLRSLGTEVNGQWVMTGPMRLLWHLTDRDGHGKGRVGKMSQLVRLEGDPGDALLETIAGLYDPHNEAGAMADLSKVVTAARGILTR